ncbi:uncharacterized protein LOC119168014 [Rhipicephalus microplus]|uniref:uncharacterized protein LOC119168014 n=1 Tax=Rhipicephalus microplus TaxID=6941 RepID=UPI003F6ABF59
MFRFTVLLILCVAVIGSHKLVDMMRGCVAKHGKQQTPGECILVPKRELRNNELYMVLAEAVLQTHYNQFPASRLNTIFNITRVGRQHLEDISKGVLVRLEFHTVPSDCMGPSFYIASECHPISTKVNGICQARFFMRHDFTVLQEFWCGRLRYIKKSGQKQCSSVTLWDAVAQGSSAADLRKNKKC